jgi:hypothetical protein
MLNLLQRPHKAAEIHDDLALYRRNWRQTAPPRITAQTVQAPELYAGVSRSSASNWSTV